MSYFTSDDIFIAQRKIAHPGLSWALCLQLKILKIIKAMYTQEQVKNLQSKLDDLQKTKDRLAGLQSMTWLNIDFGYDGGKCCDLPTTSSTDKKIQELLLTEYASRVKTLQDEIDNTMIINLSKL